MTLLGNKSTGPAWSKVVRNAGISSCTHGDLQQSDNRGINYFIALNAYGYGYKFVWVFCR